MRDVAEARENVKAEVKRNGKGETTLGLSAAEGIERARARAEAAELIRDALVDDDKQCYCDLVRVVGEPLGYIYQAYQKLKVQQG